MILIRNLKDLPEIPGSVVTDGMFDGVHLGHRQILQQVVNRSREMQLPSVLLTYWPHPRHVLAGRDAKVSLLTSLEEKAELIADQGIDYMVVVPFTLDFSQMSHGRFVEEILVNGLNVRHLIVGYDHRFGQNRLGNIYSLKASGANFGFQITEIGKQEVEAIAVSSTKIRQALEHFQPETARQFLGRPYSIRGRVVEGDKRGRTIGFPTANLQADEPDKLIPANGVYASRCRIDGVWLDAMTNIGYRPTVDGSRHAVETHIFDFSGDLYGKSIDIAFYSALRREEKFEGLEALTAQLRMDRDNSRRILLNEDR